MFTSTSINHTVFQNILKASREALRNPSKVAYVQNRKGKNYLRIKVVKSIYGHLMFEVLNNKGVNIRRDLFTAIDRFISLNLRQKNNLMTTIGKRFAYNMEVEGDL